MRFSRLPYELVDLIYNDFFSPKTVFQTEVLPEMMQKLLIRDVYWVWDYYDERDEDFGPCISCIAYGSECFTSSNHDGKEHRAPVRIDWYPELREHTYPVEHHHPWIFLGREFEDNSDFYRPLTYSVFEHFEV